MLGPDFADKLSADLAPSATRLRICNAGRFLNGRLAAGAEFNPEEFATEAVTREAEAEPEVPFDTSFNFGFDFAPTEELSTIAPENAATAAAITSSEFNPSRRSPSRAPPTPRPAVPPKSLSTAKPALKASASRRSSHAP